MTQEDKDRILGQADREYRDAKQELAALKTKMRKLGERLVQVGHVLTNAPENLIFNGQEHDLQFQSLLNPIATVEEFAEVQNLLPLTNKIRDMVLKVDKLRKELAQLRGEDPDGGEAIYHPPSRPRF